MADDARLEYLAEFERAGEEQVRIWANTPDIALLWPEGKRRAAHEFLSECSLATKKAKDELSALARDANNLTSSANTIAERALESANTNNIIATLALIVTAIAIVVTVIVAFVKK